ncbi:uncharacterized protein LOC664256 [Tribolium castaneum]|uniref:DUF4485 domain-containing protein n=1 Tax=Tribolium castaneum TaxID=7070 RepID=D2A3G4_TRICA|nr:PREDICTED: uncharacterized protein LOC664256 [Tribolium castaneum]EFA02313.1 hypothetical protein TcasGA2_TC007979 [Tribolium castaneum]|eukprot:XP_976478.1 PREDICTED: uncharacterized protein LOC664256 [Tribolium castaneum]
MEEEEENANPVEEDNPPDEPPPPEPEPEPEPVIEETPKEVTINEPDAPKPPVDAPTTNQDALSMEFLYYGSVLKVIAPTLSSDRDKEMALPWIRKLFRPEYQTSKLREKRNRYLISLTINLLNDEISGVFEKSPPDDALADLRSILPDPSTAAEWEADRMWQETLLSLSDDFEMMGCCVHGSKEECQQDHNLDKVLDQEFQYLLYLTRPYAALLPAEDKTRTAAWLQTLCTIHGEACSAMKAIRNDYIMALVGYLHDLRIVGPFTDYPPDFLEPLNKAAKKSARINPVIDPTGPEANQFLLDQPVPDDGAFCYVALTGDLVASNL